MSNTCCSILIKCILCRSWTWLVWERQKNGGWSLEKQKKSSDQSILIQILFWLPRAGGRRGRAAGRSGRCSGRAANDFLRKILDWKNRRQGRKRSSLTFKRLRDFFGKNNISVQLNWNHFTHLTKKQKVVPWHLADGHLVDAGSMRKLLLLRISQIYYWRIRCTTCQQYN